MKRLVLSPAILAVLVVLGGFPVAFATQSRPFNGSFSGSFTLTSATTATVTSTGYFEHLGKTTIASTATGTGSSAACEGGETDTEQQTFTSANGDEIFSSAMDVTCPTSPTVFQLTATFTITGGTGRFADASGSGITQLTATFTSMTTGTFSGTSTGTISY